MNSLESIAKTIEELDHHKSLPLLRRIGRRAIGRYPSSQHRESLRRHEIGPFGRIADDTAKALHWTKRLGSTPRSHLVREWREPQEAATVLMDITPGTENAKIIDRIFDRGPMAPKEMAAKDLRVGLFVPDSSPMLAAVEVRTKGVGVYTESSLYGVQTKVFLRHEIESLPENLQAGLEQLVKSVENHASVLYKGNMPATIQ